MRCMCTHGEKEEHLLSRSTYVLNQALAKQASPTDVQATRETIIEIHSCIELLPVMRMQLVVPCENSECGACVWHDTT